MSRIGFIGVGNMGKPMVKNLLESGHSVKIFDLSEKAMESVVGLGAMSAKSVADAMLGVEFVVTMLPTGKEVQEIFVSRNWIGGADKGTIFIDCSTIDVAAALSSHSAVKNAGFDMLDAPVSGGTIGAKKGTLTFMCGGEKEILDQARGILVNMGKNIVYCGGPGQGQVVKICNNMVAGIISLATAEAFVLGEKLGVDRGVLFNVMSTSSANSWVINNVCPLPGGIPGSGKSSDFVPGFSSALMLKDLRLSQDAADISGSSTPLGAAAVNAFQQHVNNGFGSLDSSSICKLIDPEIT